MDGLILRWLCLFFLVSVISTADDDVVTETFHGKLRGKVLTTSTGSYHVYLGVSYANPPQKVNRFKVNICVRMNNESEFNWSTENYCSSLIPISIGTSSKMLSMCLDVVCKIVSLD